MSKTRTYLLLFMACYGLVSCTAASKRKSATYYKQNQAKIEETLQQYEKLYAHQPFSAGFTDKSFQYYLMEVSTDTLRYIINSDNNLTQLGQVIQRFNYDTVQLRVMARNMRDIKCLWLSKSSFFIGDQRETITFLSFKSATVDKPFVENKYYVLIFLKRPINSSGFKERLKNGNLVKINDLVYFTISSKFR